MDRAFGSIIYSLRKEANLTQAALAKKAHLTQSAISRLEDGSRWPARRTIRLICNALNVPVDEFFELAADNMKMPDAKRWSEYEKEDEENE